MSEAYGIPASEIAMLCGVDIATARRWKRGTSRIPMAARKLLAGDLSAFGKEWKGWTIRNGKLISPEGWDYSPGDVLSLTFVRTQVAHLERLRRDHERLEEQPDIDRGRSQVRRA